MTSNKKPVPTLAELKEAGTLAPPHVNIVAENPTPEECALLADIFLDRIIGLDQPVSGGADWVKLFWDKPILSESAKP